MAHRLSASLVPDVQTTSATLNDAKTYGVAFRDRWGWDGVVWSGTTAVTANQKNHWNPWYVTSGADSYTYTKPVGLSDYQIHKEGVVYSAMAGGPSLNAGKVLTSRITSGPATFTSGEVAIAGCTGIFPLSTDAASSSSSAGFSSSSKAWRPVAPADGGGCAAGYTSTSSHCLGQKTICSNVGTIASGSKVTFRFRYILGYCTSTSSRGTGPRLTLEIGGTQIWTKDINVNGGEDYPFDTACGGSATNFSPTQTVTVAVPSTVSGALVLKVYMVDRNIEVRGESFTKGPTDTDVTGAQVTVTRGGSTIASSALVLTLPGGPTPGVTVKTSQEGLDAGDVITIAHTAVSARMSTTPSCQVCAAVENTSHSKRSAAPSSQNLEPRFGNVMEP